MPIFNDLGKKFSAFSQDIANQSRTMADNAKWNREIDAEEEKQEELFTNLGRQYYSRLRFQGVTPPEEDVFLFASIDASREKVTDLKKQIAASQGKVLCPKCGKEHETGARFCIMCGAPLTAPEAE